MRKLLVNSSRVAGRHAAVVLQAARTRNHLLRIVALLALTGSATITGPAPSTQARNNADAYVLPPKLVAELFDRDKNLAVLEHPAPSGDLFLLPQYTEMSTLKKMALETIRPAMLEIRPETDRLWQLDTFGIYGLNIFSLAKQTLVSVQIPAGTLVSDMVWSPDGSHLAYLVHEVNGTYVWVADTTTGQAERWNNTRILATLATRSQGTDFGISTMLQWTPAGTLVTLAVPENRGPRPQRSMVPNGPIVRRTRDEATPTRTLPFLLRDEHDETLFRHYTTSQIVELNRGSAPNTIGLPGLFHDIRLSPDGHHLLAERSEEPLSTIVGHNSFARRLEVISMLDGSVVTLRETPLREAISRSDRQPSVQLPRAVSWRPDGAGLSLLWQEPAEEEAGSDRGGKTHRRDRLMLWRAPFNPTVVETLLTTADTLLDVNYSLDGRYAVVRLDRKENNREAIVAYDLSAPPLTAVELVSFDPEEILDLPGEPLTTSTPNGIKHVRLSRDGKQAYLHGPGYREDFRHRPFIDAVPIIGGNRIRIFEGSADAYERPLAVLDNDLDRMIVSREGKNLLPDSYLWRRGLDTWENLTRNVDPFPRITAAKRQDFQFVRRDGVKVRGRISLPLDHQEGERAPAIFWTYPREYASEEEYWRATLRARNSNAYTPLSYLRWSDIWLTQGYAIVYPDIPIIGHDYNDNYIAHLTDSVYAAIRSVDAMGLVDIDRIGHGGHSYGAFATANLLAHTPFFRAGIAGNGAYNRTLTPMSFQSERRFLWEAPDVYLEMSPFFDADHLDTPLLLYHGVDDNNSGTWPIQSERFMQALTGLGKTAVLYLYPFESHSPRAKATYLDLWARWLDWFDRFVRSSEDTTDPE